MASTPASLLDSMTQAFTEAVVRAAPGGPGVGATLTPLGAEVLERYRHTHDRASDAGPNI
jgi:molybdenum-dependent DNA-binding transcriptional regulator ModE